MKRVGEPLIYSKKPLFGLDIGLRAVKFVQIKQRGKSARMVAWGMSSMHDKVMQNGVIDDVELMAQIIERMVSHSSIGKITTNRVAMSIPVSKVFTRVLTLPSMKKRDLDEAVEAEIAQSVPVPIEKLYWDYETLNDEGSKTTQVQVLATPRAIVDSYEAVCSKLGLELVLIQTNMHADARMCSVYGEVEDQAPTIIIDIGGNNTDIGVLDYALRATGTLGYGGDSLTDAISKNLKISAVKAHHLKVTQGLNHGKNQKEIQKALDPILGQIVTQVEKMTRYYSDHISDKAPVSQVLLVGGGSNILGLGDYFVNKLHMPARVVSPWSGIDMAGLPEPDTPDLPRFLTCIGLGLADSVEVLK